jgi:alkylated DNA repair protein alkB family protein 7
MTATMLWKGRSFLRPKLIACPSRLFTNLGHTPLEYPPDLYFWPKYLTSEEQRTLLAACLHKLDNIESRQARKKRRDFWKSNRVGPKSSLVEMFAPDELYEFEEARSNQLPCFSKRLTCYVHMQGHYDGVIRYFREMHLSSWPVAEFGGLQPILDRLYSLCPTPAVQTHLLHLASHGEILPHIDNIEASGSWILGISLGAERILRIQRADKQKGGTHCLTLHSGSIYLQRSVAPLYTIAQSCPLTYAISETTLDTITYTASRETNAFKLGNV